MGQEGVAPDGIADGIWPEEATQGLAATKEKLMAGDFADKAKQSSAKSLWNSLWLKIFSNLRYKFSNRQVQWPCYDYLR